MAARTHPLRILASAALVLVAGCDADIPAGKLACNADADCPSGWSCVGGGAGKRCYDALDARSAGADAAAARDAAAPARAGDVEPDAASGDAAASADAGGASDASSAMGRRDAGEAQSDAGSGGEECDGVACGTECCPADNACHEGACVACASPPADFGDACECQGTIGCDGSCIGRPPALGVACGCGGEIVCSGACTLPECPPPTVGGAFTEGGTVHDSGPAYTLGKTYEPLTLSGILPVAGQLSFWVLLPAHAPNQSCGASAVVVVWIRIGGAVQSGLGVNNFSTTEATWHRIGRIPLEAGAYDVSAEAGEGDGCGYPETSDPVYLSDIVLEPR